MKKVFCLLRLTLYLLKVAGNGLGGFKREEFPIVTWAWNQQENQFQNKCHLSNCNCKGQKRFWRTSEGFLSTWRLKYKLESHPFTIMKIKNPVYSRIFIRWCWSFCQIAITLEVREIKSWCLTVLRNPKCKPQRKTKISNFILIGKI